MNLGNIFLFKIIKVFLQLYVCYYTGSRSNTPVVGIERSITPSLH